MADILDQVKTVILLMFENRSFDHMLGHVSYNNPASKIEGLRPPLNQYSNLYEGDSYIPFPFTKDVPLDFDLPHEYNEVATQLAYSDVSKRFTMSGFVEAFAAATGTSPNPQNCEPMGFFNSDLVPVTHFLANTFCTCDHWFAPLPTSTQPNRTMAFSGDSTIYKTTSGLIPVNNNLFAWMDRAKISWRVYHDGLSFFALYPNLWDYVLGTNFKRYEYLASDMLNEPQEAMPQVIIIEPSYQEGPHIGSDHPNDNHAPLAIGWGEDFLRRTYEAVTANHDKWRSTVMIVYYDEHGGFFDHVPPPLVRYKTIGNEPYQFNSLGPRIPGMIISPFVQQKSVCSSLLDHTSVLQFLAQKFTPGQPYSPTVANRQQQGIASIVSALTNPTPWTPPPPPNQPIQVQTVLGNSVATAPVSTMGQSFESAAQQLLIQKHDDTVKKYPELVQWKIAVDNARR